ncbi:MAG TPA: hypothetical protein VD906_04745 [Caulobacteraceae bacterium]|nr:hypothetical protein [Caulobacteraceae bacterium]
MRIATAFIVAVMAASAAAPALAQSDRVSDVEFLQAARCRGLVASQALGATDAASLEAFLNVQGKSRNAYVLDKADQVAADAKRAAKRAGPERRATLSAELAGACARFMS